MRVPNEIKAGLVVIMAVGIGVVFFLKTVNLRTETYDIKTSFRFAGDLKPDAVVKLSGVEVGRLKAMKFIYEPETRVECLLEIDSTAMARADSIAYIGSAGFVGDAYVGLTPGTGNFIKPGSTVASEDPMQIRQLMKKADEIADNLNGVLTDVKALVTDNREGINKVVGNLESTTENFKEFSEDVKKHPWKLLFKGD